MLPFQNQGASTDEYFADGIADEVRGKLSRVSGLKVIASSSASQYKGSTKSPQVIASELGADYLLSGTVRWATGADGKRRVQVVPELIDAGSGDVKWQQSFDTDITDVFEVQSQIATRVAGALGVALGGNEQLQLTKRPTDNVEAYQLYLKGRAVQSGDPVSLRESVAYLEQAVALDSTFGDAWASLSMQLSRLYHERHPQSRHGPAGQGGAGTSCRARSGRREDAPRSGAVQPDRLRGTRTFRVAEMDLALRAAPTDAEVLSAAGLSDMGAGDLGSALAKLERAREIDPRSYITLYSLSQVYDYLGRPADGEATAAAALLVRPGDLNAIQWLAIARVAQGKLEEARAGIRSAIESGVPAPSIAAHFAGYQETTWILEDRERQLVFRLTPSAFDNDRAWWGQALATAYWQAGDLVKARAYADSALPLSKTQAADNPGDAQLQVLYGLMLAMAGKAAEAEVLLAKALELAAAGTTQHYYILLNAARIETVLGNKDRAIDFIEESRKKGGILTPQYLALDPTFASLKGNPRFERLLK